MRLGAPTVAGIRGKRSWALFYLILSVSAFIYSCEGYDGGGPMRLPEKVGGWTRREPPQRIEPGGIFDYMDGAGELYLAYRLQHIDVCRYAGADDTEILVEIYQVQSSDDAYGLLSLA